MERLYGDGESLQCRDAITAQDIFYKKISNNQEDGNPDDAVAVTQPDAELSAAYAFYRLCNHKKQIHKRCIRYKWVQAGSPHKLAAKERPHCPCSAAARTIVAADLIKQAGRQQSANGRQRCGSRGSQPAEQVQVVFDRWG